MTVPSVFMVGVDRLALIPEYLNLGSVVIVAPDAQTLRAWQQEQAPPSPGKEQDEHPVVVDMQGRRIVHEGASIPLSDREFRVLGALLAQPGRAFSFRALRRIGWDDACELPIDPYAVKAAIQRLRVKLEVAGAPVAIEAVPGYGFRLMSAHGTLKRSEQVPVRVASGPGHG